MLQERQQSAQNILQEAKSYLEDQDGFSDRSCLTCIRCERQYPSKGTPTYNCEDDRRILDVTYDFEDTDPDELKAVWEIRKLSNKSEDVSGVWRFREMLPFVESPQDIVTLGEGNTRLLTAPRCSEYVGMPNLLIKHQGFNPTGSFKDVGMSAAITHAKSLGMKAVACASTGNTSASMAAYAERAGMLPIVFIPEDQVAYGKLSQALDYGALTVQIKDNFDKAMSLVMDVAPEMGVYVVNSINPFRIEGQKTIMFELLEQMNWQVPDRIVVPGGNLGHASSIGKAIHEMVELGFIKEDEMPKITVVQAAGANPLYLDVTNSDPDKINALHARTLASAIKIGHPISIDKALRSLRETDGWVEYVTEQEIADAKAMVGRDGIGCEPASAVTIAGLKKIMQNGTDVRVDRDEIVVAILTGNVLKDPDYTVSYHTDKLYFEEGKIKSTYANAPVTVGANVEEIKSVIEKRLQ